MREKALTRYKAAANSMAVELGLLDGNLQFARKFPCLGKLSFKKSFYIHLLKLSKNVLLESNERYDARNKAKDRLRWVDLDKLTSV